MNSFLMGLDLGQAQDYTALAIAEQQPGEDYTATYHVRHLQRFKLGTPYPDIVAAVAALLASPQLEGQNVSLVVDATGVGAPVIDLLDRADLPVTPIAVSITGGDTVSQDGRNYRVPKRDLVSVCKVLLQTERLQFAELPDTPTLVNELLSFQVKIDPKTAHDSYAVWREGVHDDLVLAVALAVWYGERGGFVGFGWAY